jgi:hypothetical protein
MMSSCSRTSSHHKLFKSHVRRHRNTGIGLGAEKRVFYEQVTGVKGLFFVFPFIGLLFLLLLLVSLLSTGFLFALWMSRLDASSVPVGGSRGESMLPFIGRPWKTKTRTQSSEHGVVATGSDGMSEGRKQERDNA